MTFDTWPDGSTRRVFVNVSGWHGFWVVDWDRREVVDKISPPPVPLSERVADGVQGAPSHGLTILPDQSQLWVSSRATGSVYAWTLPDLEDVGRIPIGNPAWLTATPEHIWVGVPSDNESVAIDPQSMEIVKRIRVGQAPKRIYTAVFPSNWGAEVAGVGDADR